MKETIRRFTPNVFSFFVIKVNRKYFKHSIYAVHDLFFKNPTNDDHWKKNFKMWSQIPLRYHSQTIRAPDSRHITHHNKCRAQGQQLIPSHPLKCVAYSAKLKYHYYYTPKSEQQEYANVRFARENKCFENAELNWKSISLKTSVGNLDTKAQTKNIQRASF